MRRKSSVLSAAHSEGEGRIAGGLLCEFAHFLEDRALHAAVHSPLQWQPQNGSHQLERVHLHVRPPQRRVAVLPTFLHLVLRDLAGLFAEVTRRNYPWLISMNFVRCVLNTPPVFFYSNYLQV